MRRRVRSGRPVRGGGRRQAYAAAGVDVAAADRAVELMRAAIETTRRPEVVGGLGGFAAGVAVPLGYREPVLISSTDGVGTKTAIAAALRRFDTIGIDLVAMCADDVVCAGATPLFFLDYVAVGQLNPDDVAALVASVAAGCRDAGCALVGGETAEHPGVMAPGEFDLAGFCVGIVERDRILDGAAVRPGDAIVGIAASGLHANGFSLVRQLLMEFAIELDRPYQEQLARTLGERGLETALGADAEFALATIGEVLMTPTRIYAPTVLRLREALVAAGFDLGAAAHVTGGGLPGNVPRMLPEGLGARLDPTRWPIPSVIRLFGALGGLDGEELRATFNGGLGMVVVVHPDGLPTALESIEASGLPAWHVGEVVPVEELAGLAYIEEPLQGPAVA
ncbi:MAG TPA: phosphoribosylformylglycinamidine cyclo-ligase [Candidatus Limnocylindrales bacterium]